MHIVATEDFDRRLEPLYIVHSIGENDLWCAAGAGMEALAFGGVNFVGFSWRQRPTAFWTVGHFSEDGLGPLKTCTQPAGTSTADHPLRGIRLTEDAKEDHATQNLGTRVNNAPFEKNLEPKAAKV